MKITSVNPSNFQKIDVVECISKKELSQVVSDARVAQPKWAALSQQQRNVHVASFVTKIDEYRDEIATIVSTEMGMPIKQSRNQVNDAIDYFNAYMEMADDVLQPEIVYQDDTQVHTIHREPLGVIACITPWNFPILNVPWQAGQALLAGNTVVYKPSEEIILFAKLLQKIVAESALPAGVFSVVVGDGSVGQQLFSEPIDAVSFTGSTETGQEVLEAGAKKSIKVMTELGGSAPGIVFEDADIPKIIDTLYFWRYNNSGQYCDGLKRLIVHESRKNDVIAALREHNKKKTVGDALVESTDIGPLVSKKQLQLLESQVQDAVHKGANVLFGGKRPENLDGAFYLPTLLDSITFDMRVWNEEVFGPVLPLVTFSTEEEAVKLANDTKYGLGAFIFTEDSEKYLRVAKQIQSGITAHNNALYFSFWSPFGGYKNSGNSRTGGKEGFHEVTQVKLMSQEK